METKIISVNDGVISKNDFGEIVTLLVQGTPVVFPTDTVYGIGVNAFKPHGIKKIYELKQRDTNKPIVWLMDSIDAIRLYVREIPSAVHMLMERFWPGALTIIFNTSPAAHAQGVTEKSIGIRIPGHALLRDLIAGAGVPLATTSANRSGSVSPTSFSQCAYFLGKLPCMLDEGILPSVNFSAEIPGCKSGDECEKLTPLPCFAKQNKGGNKIGTTAVKPWGSRESTIVDGRNAVPHIIREGAISCARIEDAIKI